MKTILFLCAGNTCRSPMAQSMFNHLCDRQGLPMRALSAGLFASEDSPASYGALAAVKARGLSLREHRSQSLTSALLEGVSLVVAMTPEYARLCQQRFPTTPLRAFSPPISDPFGSSQEVYEQTARALEKQIPALIAELSKDLT